jgi:hypothetical protein
LILRRREFPWLTGQIYVQPLHFVFHHGPNGQAGVLWFWHRHRNPWIRKHTAQDKLHVGHRVCYVHHYVYRVWLKAQPFGRIAGRRHVVARNRIKHWQGSESQHRHRPRTTHTQPWWGRCWWRLYWWLLGSSWPSETWRLRVVPPPTSPGISSRGGMSERECTLEKRGKFQNGGEPVRGGPRSTRIKSAIPSANGRRAAKHEHGRNDDGKSTAVCSRKNGYGKGWRDGVAQLGPAGQRTLGPLLAFWSQLARRPRFP